MQARIKVIHEKKLIGKRLTMSFNIYKISELWKTFSPRRNEISNTTSNELISLVVYKSDHFKDFKPSNEFERWAAVEVKRFDIVPKEMETFILPGGLYAVFEYKGLNTDPSIFRYIFEKWLPDSDYLLDDRPHFEVLGEKYKNNDPDSEEEIYIPIKQK